jgi:hypothetical protein
MPYPRATPAQHSHEIFPSPVTGYRLNGRWEVVEPVGANVINLVSNPSLELNSMGYAAQGSATIARDSTQQRRGVYSLKVTPTSAQLDGVYYGTVTEVGQSTYTFSFDFKGAGGVRYRFYAASLANNAISPVISHIASGGWERLSVTYREPYSASVAITRRLYITKDYNTSTASFWIDGLSVTATAYPVTYFDGDSVGFIVGRSDFFWNGTEHGSTSTMASFTRAGGKITPLSKYGLTILAFLGLGMQPITNVSTPLAFIGGGQYQRTISQERLFDLAGSITGSTLQELQVRRNKIMNLLKPDATPTDSPLLLLYTPVDDCGEVVGETLEIPCVYESGMEGSINNHYQEQLSLRFHSYLPFLGSAVGEAGQSLNYQRVLPSGRIFSRDGSGIWSRVADGLNGSVNVILPLPDGRLLVGGEFTNAGGNANADYLAVYDYNTNQWSALNTTPLGDFVYTLAILSDQTTVLVGGAFINAGGNSSADLICALNLTTGLFSALNSTPLIGTQVYDILALPDGSALVGGDFTNAGGFSNADYLATINATTYAFGALNATPLENHVEALALLNNGDVVLCGSFVDAGGDTDIRHIAYLTISTGAYSTLNNDTATFFSETPISLEVSPGGLLYIGSNLNIYSWAGPGQPYTILDGGLSGGFLSNSVLEIESLSNGVIMFSGYFANAGNLSLPGWMAGWNGSSFFYGDIDTSATNAVGDLAITRDGKFVIGLIGAAITGPASGSNIVVNNGTSNAAPIFILTGPGTVYSIRNVTTDETLYFNLTLNAGERAILNLTPGNIRFYSNFRSNLLGTILPGSSLATFRFTPGTNYISVFVAGTVNANTDVRVRWRETFWNLDGAIDAL